MDKRALDESGNIRVSCSTGSAGRPAAQRLSKPVCQAAVLHSVDGPAWVCCILPKGVQAVCWNARGDFSVLIATGAAQKGLRQLTQDEMIKGLQGTWAALLTLHYLTFFSLLLVAPPGGRFIWAPLAPNVLREPACPVVGRPSIFYFYCPWHPTGGSTYID